MLAYDPYFTILEDVSQDYNCIAWALQVEQRWMWPMDAYETPETNVLRFWPHGCRHDEHIDNFVEVFERYGYSICEHYKPEQGVQKIALYKEHETNLCSHAARELLNSNSEYNLWSSKLGDHALIQHSSPLELQGPFYGKIHCYMKKEIP
jgi:hypothetical protein